MPCVSFFFTHKWIAMLEHKDDLKPFSSGSKGSTWDYLFWLPSCISFRSVICCKTQIVLLSLPGIIEWGSSLADVFCRCSTRPLWELQFFGETKSTRPLCLWNSPKLQICLLEKCLTTTTYKTPLCGILFIHIMSIPHLPRLELNIQNPIIHGCFLCFMQKPTQFLRSCFG